METKHTPGPWEIGTARHCILGKEIGRGRFTICVMQNTHIPEQEANARLIVAAPTILETALPLMDYLAFMAATGATRYPFKPSPEGERKLAAFRDALLKTQEAI